MGDNIKKGAGILFVCTEDNTALLIRRSIEVTESGTWGISGGNSENDETAPKTALRETIEELGSIPRGRIVEMLENTGAGWKFNIFVADIPWVQKKLWTSKIKLNYESDLINWFPLNSLPDNLHSAVSIIRT